MSAELQVADARALLANYGHVPLRLSADVPLPPMTLRALQSLAPGMVLTSSNSVADDLQLTLGGAPLCWGRFAAVDGRMVLRVVRLA